MWDEEMKELEGGESFVRMRECALHEAVGIDSAPHQYVKKRLQEGFTFNVLLIGETGIGKSTLASSLFNIPLISKDSHMHSEVKLKSHTYDLREKNVNLKLTIVETVGYGDKIDRKDSVEPIINYIEGQFEKYFDEELKMKRSLFSYHDTRIHACLYFICPTGHSLRAIDIFCMKQLQDKVNLIPIVARADSLSKQERQLFKSAIRSAIENHGIKIYNFPTEDEEISDSNIKANEHVPFAVAASGDYVCISDKLTRARIFPWGTMVVENEDHSEFLVLRRALIEINMENMIEKTKEYYEKYRRKRFCQFGNTGSGPEDKTVTYQEFIQNQRKVLREKMLEEEEQLRKRYIEKMNAKDAELRNHENAIVSKYKKILDELTKEEEDILSLKNKLELEIRDFNNKKNRAEKNREALEFSTLIL